MNKTFSITAQFRTLILAHITHMILPLIVHLHPKHYIYQTSISYKFFQSKFTRQKCQNSTKKSIANVPLITRNKTHTKSGALSASEK